MGMSRLRSTRGSSEYRNENETNSSAALALQKASAERAKSRGTLHGSRKDCYRTRLTGTRGMGL
jgi:hypothetical protein